MNSGTPIYSVVVPVYNSENTLLALHQRLSWAFEKAALPFELILVNDASKDGSAKVAEQLARENDNVVFADLMRNFGQQNATLCGLSLAKGDIIITMDDDLQNPPEEIPELISTMEKENQEVVYGIPEKKRHTRHRNLGTKLVAYVLRKLFGTNIQGASSFRIMTRKVVDYICQYPASFTFIDGLIFQHTSYVGYKNVRHDSRKKGTSNYTLRKLMLLAMNLFFNFSITPLRFVFFAGIAVSAGAAVFAIMIIIGKLTGYITYPGWASIMTFFSFLFGLMFMFLGLIGEYVGRIAQGVSRAPQFAIRKVISRKDSFK